MPRADCAADWPCEVLPRAVVVYRSYCTSLKGDLGMWSCESLCSSQRKAGAELRGGTGEVCEWQTRDRETLPSRTENKQSERPAYSPVHNGMLQQMFPKFAISGRVDSSLRRGLAAQGGDNSEQFPRVRPRSRRAISSAVSFGRTSASISLSQNGATFRSRSRSRSRLRCSRLSPASLHTFSRISAWREQTG